MKITKKNLPKSQVELTIEMSYEEFKPYLLREAEKITIAGFRPGNASYEIIKQKIGETKLLNEALPEIFKDTLIDACAQKNLDVIGEPLVNIEKLDHGKYLVYKATVSILPKAVLGDYKNIKVKKREVSIEEREIEKVLRELQEHQAKEVITDRASKKGDVINVDFNMLLDNVPIEGGQGKNQRMILGENNFAPFNENLTGIKKGEEKKFEVPYPQDHFDKKLAGKTVTFQFKVNEIYERTLPEINDELAKSLGKFNTLEELKKHIKNIIKKDKDRYEQERFEGEILDKLVSISTFDEIPDILMESEIDKMLHELEANISSQGGKFEDYLSHIKKTKEDLKKDFEDEAIKRIKTALAIRNIANIEDIKVEEKEIEDKINVYKAYMSSMSQSQLTPQIEKRLSSDEYKNYIKNILINKKVIEKLAE